MATSNVSIRSNSVPPGGTTAINATPPTQTSPELQALIDELTPVVTKFRQNSSPQNTQLNQSTVNVGGQDIIRISSVGIGTMTYRHHHLVINLKNNATTAQTVNLSPTFPYDYISSTEIGINVGSKTYSASGPAGLYVIGRVHRGSLRAVNNGLDPAICTVSFGSNLTPTASSSFTLSGYDSVSVAASSSGTITADFITVEKMVYTLDSMIGGLPLQNNSVFATLTTTGVSTLIGSDVTTPLFVTGGPPSTLTGTGVDTIDSEYDYWGVPSDPALFAAMVTNSYQVLEQKGGSTNSTGQGAITYDIPQNELLIALHLTAIQGASGSKTFLTPAQIQQIKVQYNGGKVVPVEEYYFRQRAKQYLAYGYDAQQLPGYRMWDGDDTSDQINNTDSAGWLDAYTAASPQFVADLASSVTTPVNYSITRESIGQGQVQVI